LDVIQNNNKSELTKKFYTGQTMDFKSSVKVLSASNWNKCLFLDYLVEIGESYSAGDYFFTALETPTYSGVPTVFALGKLVCDTEVSYMNHARYIMLCPWCSLIILQVASMETEMELDIVHPYPQGLNFWRQTMVEKGVEEVSWPGVRVPPLRSPTYEYLSTKFLKEVEEQDVLGQSLRLVIPAIALFTNNGTENAGDVIETIAQLWVKNLLWVYLWVSFLNLKIIHDRNELGRLKREIKTIGSAEGGTPGRPSAVLRCVGGHTHFCIAFSWILIYNIL
jgi:hypothetical protein